LGPQSASEAEVGGACQIILLFEDFAWPRLQLTGINPDEPLGGDAGIGLCFIVI